MARSRLWLRGREKKRGANALELNSRRGKDREVPLDENRFSFSQGHVHLVDISLVLRPFLFAHGSRARCTIADLAPPAVPMGLSFTCPSLHRAITSRRQRMKEIPYGQRAGTSVTAFRLPVLYDMKILRRPVTVELTVLFRWTITSIVCLDSRNETLRWHHRAFWRPEPGWKTPGLPLLSL